MFERPMTRREFLYGGAGITALPLLGGAAPRPSDKATPEQLYQWATDNLRAGLWHRRSAGFLQRAVAAEPKEPHYREALACACFDRALEIYAWSEKSQAPAARGPLPWLAEDGPIPGRDALTAEARAAARKALREIREAARLDPDNPEFRHTQGWILAWAYQGRDFLELPKLKPEQAKEAFETAIRLAPEKARFHRSLGDGIRMVAPPAAFLAPLPPVDGPPPPAAKETARVFAVSRPARKR